MSNFSPPLRIDPYRSGLCNDTIIALLNRNYGTVGGPYRQNVKNDGDSKMTMSTIQMAKGIVHRNY
jgi:hypothetical protein